MLLFFTLGFIFSAIAMQENESGEKLIDAASMGQLEKVKEILTLENINYQDKGKNTALLNAMNYGYKDIVKFLVEKGAGLNYQNKFGETVLMYSIHDNDLMKLFIGKGANLNLQDNNGETVLMHLIKYAGFLHQIQCLVGYGADLSLQNNKKQTALQIAQERFVDNPKDYDDYLGSILRYLQSLSDRQKTKYKTFNKVISHDIKKGEETSSNKKRERTEELEEEFIEFDEDAMEIDE